VRSCIARALVNVTMPSVFLHEVAHNLQSDLGLWHENREAVARRLAVRRADPLVASVYGRWHKEIFADLAAMLLGSWGSPHRHGRASTMPW
jgi:hypothetical protein